MIDNVKGLFMTANGENSRNEVVAKRLKIFGESEADDCAGRDCFCANK